MRTCDICQKDEPNAQSFDRVLISAFKDAQITKQTASVILEKVGIKQSIVEQKQAFGDVCDTCRKNLAALITKTIDDSVTALTKSLTEIANTAKGIVGGESENKKFFDSVTKEHNMGFSWRNR